MNANDTGETRFTLDPGNLPTMSAEEMARLRAMRDEEIDLSDLPEQTGPPVRRILGPRFRARETVVALAPDVEAYFVERGEFSATQINAVLREYVEARRKTA